MWASSRGSKVKRKQVDSKDQKQESRFYRSGFLYMRTKVRTKTNFLPVSHILIQSQQIGRLEYAHMLATNFQGSNIVLAVIVAVTLVIMATTDIKNRTLPVALFLPMVLFCLTYGLGAFSSAAPTYLLATSMFGIIFTAFALIGKCGGGDVIMMVAISLCYGFERTIWIVMLASVAMLLWHFARYIRYKIRSKDATGGITTAYPYAPFVLFGFCMVQAAVFFRGA
jgi:prepilin signal peptidase PulO-like enzyme (type II secretory pathway)